MAKKVHFDALRKDERIWNDASETLSGLSTSAGNINVYREAFSFAGYEVADKYDELRTLVISLLSAGATEAAGAATALKDIRTAIEADENAAVTEFGGAWDPRDI